MDNPQKTMTTVDSEIEIPFAHHQTSHCESGVASNLLSHYGHPVSEAMAFGIGEGLFFGYLPFIRVNKLPLTTYRCAVGGIFKRLTHRLKIQVRKQQFRSPQKAMQALDGLLDRGIVVGCRTGGYWLPYFPEAFRFHINMHNLIVYGKKGDDYLISDPVFPEPVVCPANRLVKARFAQGALAPKGYMYHILRVPDRIDFTDAVRHSIKGVCRTMQGSRIPLLGIAGIRFLAKRLAKWPNRLGPEKAALYLGQVIRMQEEIGTGGAGFRFIFAAFLQEAAAVLDEPRLEKLSKKMTATGDRWRRFALLGSRICKGRAREDESYPAMAAILEECADRESEIYRELQETIDRSVK
jgi:hypothetical protein